MNTSNTIKLEVLGARGSMPTHRPDCVEFGGATSCYRLEADDTVIFLDGGTGMIGRDATGERTDIILSHFHMDHIAGLPGYHGLSDPGHTTIIHAPTLENMDSGIMELRELISPPIWPLGLEGYPGNVKIVSCEKEFEIGPFSITTFDGLHPNGCIIIVLTVHDKKIVYATDYEHDGAGDKALIDISHEADLLIYDGCYLPEEYPRFKTFGHSTPDDGIRVATAAEAKRLLITHHSTERSDEELREIEETYRPRFSDIRFARVGDIYRL